MSFFKMKRRTEDSLFSLAVRIRDKWTCQRCGRVWPGNSAGLTCSHFFGRRKESVRFDLENCDSLCMFPCHNEWEHEKGVTVGTHSGKKIELARPYRAWKIQQLGAKRFAALEVRSEMHVKRDRKLILIYVKELLKKLRGDVMVGKA